MSHNTKVRTSVHLELQLPSTLLTIEQNDNRPETGIQESHDEDGQSVLSVLKGIAEAQ